MTHPIIHHLETMRTQEATNVILALLSFDGSATPEQLIDFLEIATSFWQQLPEGERRTLQLLAAGHNGNALLVERKKAALEEAQQAYIKAFMERPGRLTADADWNVFYIHLNQLWQAMMIAQRQYEVATTGENV